MISKESINQSNVIEKVTTNRKQNEKGKKDSLSDKWRCFLCENVATNPIVTECNHVFCANCILYHLENNSTCPKCRKPIPSHSLLRLYGIGESNDESLVESEYFQKEPVNHKVKKRSSQYITIIVVVILIVCIYLFDSNIFERAGVSQIMKK